MLCVFVIKIDFMVFETTTQPLSQALYKSSDIFLLRTMPDPICTSEQCSDGTEYAPIAKALTSLDATSEQRLSGMPVVPFSFGGRTTNSDK